LEWWIPQSSFQEAGSVERTSAMRWAHFIGQIGPLTSLSLCGWDKIWSHYRPDGEFCRFKRGEVLHGHPPR
jgi:hypothetical protein